MSLVGNLEDLGLGDILQIVSLSRKSGVLSLTWDERKGRIIFRDGQVVGAESNERPERLETLIARAKILSPENVKNAVSLKRGIGETKSLREIIVERLQADNSKIEDALREHVETVVFGFFMWPEGNFNFELKDPDFEKTELDENTAEMLLESGMNPQFLAMEGTRLQDEARRDGAFRPVPMPGQAEEKAPPAQEGEGAETSASPQPAGESQAAATGGASEVADKKQNVEEEISRVSAVPQVVVIDDDPEISALITRYLAGMGYSSQAVQKVVDGLNKVKELISQGFCPVVIADMFMPRSDGEGILGGVEIVESVKSSSPYVPVLLVSDYPNQKAEEKAREAGLDEYIDKPKRTQIWGEEPTPELSRFKEELTRLVPELVEKAVPPPEAPETTQPQAPPQAATPQPQTPPQTQPTPQQEQKSAQGPEQPMPGPPTVEEESWWDPGREISLELGEEPHPYTGEEMPQVSRGLGLLKSMISELHDPEFSGQITLMVLRFAAELMNRAVIFLVMRDKVAGLGQFGVELNGIDPFRQVRRMRIPLNEASIFRDVVTRRSSYKKELAETKWNNYLVQCLGGVKPAESFAAPIIASGRVAAVLYGDNVPDEKPIGDTDSLEIFLAQAGLAMERALLERKLTEISGREGSNRSASYGSS